VIKVETCAPHVEAWYLSMMIHKEKQLGGHQMNAYNISNDECIHFAQQPLERNTYDKLILKIAHSGMMLMTSFRRCKLYPKIIADD